MRGEILCFLTGLVLTVSNHYSSGLWNVFCEKKIEMNWSIDQYSQRSECKDVQEKEVFMEYLLREALSKSVADGMRTPTKLWETVWKRKTRGKNEGWDVWQEIFLAEMVYPQRFSCAFCKENATVLLLKATHAIPRWFAINEMQQVL